MRQTIKAITAATLLAASAIAAAGVETSTDANDVILAGHDAVAYFTAGKPVLGSEHFTAQHDGAVYRFASAANRDQFRAHPEKYTPAYGGYCAYGLALGKKFDVNGKAFRIVEGRLYVNKNLDALQAWKKDIPGNIVKAEGQWPLISDVAPGKL